MRFFSYLRAAAMAAGILAIAAPFVRSQSAVFTGFDTATKGNWVGTYGEDGFYIANDTSVVPSYGTATFGGQSTWTWVASTPDVRALYSTNSISSNRIASTYYSGTSFNINVNFNDNQSHQVALYSLDLDTTARSQTIYILNASTNAQLDKETVSSFTGGVWAVWNISGNVIIQVSNNPGSLNAVVSGIFFKTLVPVAKPTVTMNTPSQNPITGPITLSAMATSPASIASVQFQSDGANIGSPVLSPSSGTTYSVQWTNPTNGPHQLTAIATDSQGQTTTSGAVPVNVSVVTSANSAAFVKTDTTTKGNWVGTYGGDGYIIPNDATVLPKYAMESTSTSALTYTWLNPSTSDTRTLFINPSSTARIASTFYTNSTFSFDIHVNDGSVHQLALYGLDYETNQRTQTVTVFDGDTNAQLVSSELMSGMYGGIYAVWNISGHVIVQVAYTGGENAVVAGLFFGGAPVTVNPPTVSLTAPTAGPVSGTVSVSSNASSSIGIASVQYYLDGATLGAPQTAGSPYSYSWDTTTASNSLHTLTAISTDTQGQKSAVSTGVQVTVSNAVVANPPSISITSPTGGTVSGAVSIQASASASSPATMSSVQFQIDGAPLATVTGAGPSFSTSWNTATASNASHTITAIATDSLGHTATASVTVTVSNVGSSTNTATFVKTDSTTSGNWPGAYGGDGYIIANSTPSQPAYLASFTPSASAQTYTWGDPNTDSRALFTSQSGGARIASTYYSSSSFSFDVNFKDSATHQVAVYALDFEPLGRAETISILDGSTNAPLSGPVSLSNFSNGVWTVWSVSGHVIVKVVCTGNQNAVVSGVFFGAPPVLPPPPTVSILTPTTGRTVTGAVNLTANASATATSVQYFLGANSIGTSTTGSSFALNWDTTTVSNSTYTLTAVAADSYGQKSTASTGVSVTVSNPVLPSISITSPTAGSVTGIVSISVTASSGNGMASVQFQIDGQPLATVTGSGPTYSASWDTTSLVTGSNHTITAIATDLASKTKSASVGVTVSNVVASPNTAAFVKSDTTTTGNWVGVYGADGYIIPNDATLPPHYVTVTPSGASLWTWSGSTTVSQALYTDPSRSNRIASCYYAGSTMSFDMNFNDGQLHQLAAYFLDDDGSTRAETIKILDASTNAVLDTEYISNFNSGIWEVWNVTGHIVMTITSTGNPNGAISGLFFRSFAGISPPVVTFTGLSNNQTVSGAVTLTANATSTQGIASVQFAVDGTNVGNAQTGSGPTYSTQWASPAVSNGQHTISAIAVDNVGLRTAANVTVQISNGPAPPASAILTSIDNYSSGSWKGVYGQDGEIIAVDSTNPPFYATVNFINTINPPWTWHQGNPTTDIPGLQDANSNQRIGAAFYQIVDSNGSYAAAHFTIDVNFVDNMQHELALYFVDWHHPVREQTVTITDTSGNQLDTETFTNFPLGVYYVWNMQGHVLINVQLDPTPWDPDSAVVSGLFFEPASIAARPTVSINAPTPNQSLSKTVTISATASSPIAMSAVQFEVDGYAVGAPVTRAPYNFQWDTTTVIDGSHVLNAIAIDSSNHAITSPPITVDVSN